MVRERDCLPVFEPRSIELGCIPAFQYSGSLASELQRGMKPDEAIALLETMLMIRGFEEMILNMKAGKFTPFEGFTYVGATHLSIGQEAVAVGTIGAIHPQDYITSTHRGHGHSVAKGAFALRGMSDEELNAWLDFNKDADNDAARAQPTLLDQAMQTHLNKMMAELLGKEEGYCRGRGGSMHIADFWTGHLGANAIVGGSMALATGAAIGCSKLQNGRRVVCLFGDGAMNNGISGESLNMAAMGQFTNGTPILYVIENNQYAMTGQEEGEVTGVDHMIRRAAGYDMDNLHSELVNGMSVLAVRDATRRAVDLIDRGDGPVAIECSTYRYYGHSLSDKRTSYRSTEEEAAWRACDPIQSFRQEILDCGVLSEDALAALDKKTQQSILSATMFAAHATDPDPATIEEGLLATTSDEHVEERWRTTEVNKEPKKVRRDSQGQVIIRHAINEALMEEMMRDRRVILYGEDIAEYGGAFAVTTGLFDIFGRNRVFNTAISEACICGAAIGMGMVGLRPVAELMYIDFVLMSMDQIGNQAAKTRYMFGGKAKIPMVIRMAIGGGKGYAGQHSQSLEGILCQIPGMKIIAPSTSYDAKGLLKAAIRDDNPVMFLEHQLLYADKGYCPEEEYTLPIGVGAIRREGTDVTIVAYSYMMAQAVKAAEILEAEGISAELVDPRTLIPLDVEIIAQSMRKTGHLALLAQAPEQGCFPSYIAYRAQEAAWSALKKAPKIIAAHNVPPPMAHTLEAEHMPSPEKIAREVKRLLEK
ncbi:MAG TPA: dehydrogenase E1 component subunit alpha/beta [Armatimonadota bacterium]|nr:dehydrogenase E1 component subunit alpha/beta [Armatimonadota bacterium]